MIISTTILLVTIVSSILIFYLFKSQTPSKRSEPLTQEQLDAQVIIVGGGPVGLLLGMRLLQLNIRTLILEKQEKSEVTSTCADNAQHTKAIGIHPPSLEIFDKIDKEIVSRLCEVSVLVNGGVCLGNGYDKVMGTLAIECIRKPYNFVLSCPQNLSEAILRDFLIKAVNGYNERNGTNLDLFLTGVSVTDVRYENKKVIVKTDENKQYTAHFAVGCDGKKSLIREISAMQYTGSAYYDTFVMGDFADNTGYGSDAAIFLADDGLVECFPLPGGIRRWVCSTDTYVKNPSKELIWEIVKTRTKFNIEKQHNSMLSTFGVQGYVVNQYYENNHHRFIVAGDAAHICSPLGGQGMNLGWLDAWELAHRFENIFHKNACITTELQAYDNKQKKLAKAVIHRAEMNMLLGRKPKFLVLRNLLVRMFLIPIPVLQYAVSSFFTMRWLGNISIGEKYVFA